MTAPAPLAPAETSQAAQAAVADAALTVVRAAWPNLNVRDLNRSLPAFRRLIAAIVRRYGNAAGTAAVRYYQMERRAAGVTAPFRPLPSPPAGPGQVAESIDWATAPLWSVEPDTQTALQRVESTTERLVLDAGRQTVIDNARKDKEARGWARIAEPDACFFCAMLATRGGVYTAEDTADFKPHDRCRCHAMPVFHVYQPSQRVTEWNDLWKSAAKGKSGPDAVKAFRRAYEGRSDGRTYTGRSRQGG